MPLHCISDFVVLDAINTLWPEQNGCWQYFQIPFLYAQVLWLKFHWRLLLRVQSTINQHQFRQWLVTKHATIHYLNKWWPSSLMYMALLGHNELIACSIRPCYINTLLYSLKNSLNLSDTMLPARHHAYVTLPQCYINTLLYSLKNPLNLSDSMLPARHHAYVTLPEGHWLT